MPKFYQNSAFRKLNRKWREKLKNNGFEDHENRSGNLRQHDRRTVAWEHRERISTFYSLMQDVLREEKLNRRDKKILGLYVEGITIGGPRGIAAQVDLPARWVKEIVSKYKKIALSRIR